MRAPRIGGKVAMVLLVALPAGNVSSQQSAVSAKLDPVRPVAARSTTLKETLPDPILLDGTIHPAERKSEVGMIGEFELPGDENVRSGRVGGPQNPNQSPGRGGGLAANVPPGGGAAGPSAQLPGGASREMASPKAPTPLAGGGAAQPNESGAGAGGPGGPTNPNAAGAAPGTPGDAGAKPMGIQVAELGGEPGGAGTSDGTGMGQKPGPAAIGDKAMRIETGMTSPGVVGAQAPVINVNTQIYEKPTGTGGKGPTGTQGPNRAEKGRTMPAGL